MPETPFLTTLRRIGVVAVIRGASADAAVAMAEALIRGGVLGIEITYSTPDCPSAIARLARSAPATAAIGVGTVRTIAELEAAHAAGATYAVSPHTDPELIARGRQLALPMLPGAITPSEIVAAWKAGATCIKLFPGSLVGPDYVKALRGPLPDIPLMPTGGVSEDNLGEWFAAGVVAVGMGGNLAKGSPAEIETAARRIMAKLATVRGA
ncbi:bifunctional 2-keto-4-hydroxyglutarate aldolase/2-keto-3-deoxy-6-phosphogluconate aldolase [Planctomycetota bacterium]|nr:bifunctional 2-keto-4-hydroxyglutarate aldolase/2-keto-3-deoxy-6-phosphogluconate aldolase [Planctomycetota bacterium]